MKRISDWINRIGEIGLVLFLVVLTVVVFLQVLFRYVIQLPLFWTEELARYCLVWASLLGAGVALKRGQHIAVTYLLDRFPAGVRKAAVRMSQVSVGFIVVVILWGGLELVHITQHQISPALRIPMSYPYLSIPIGAVMMLIHIIASFFQPVQASTDDSCRT